MVQELQSPLWQSDETQSVTVQRGDVWQLGTHRLLCGDSTNREDVARLLQGETASLIFADPPYGIGIDAWDTALPDVQGFIDLCISHLAQGGFFTLTHQMPYMVEWLHVLQGSKLRYKDHIEWIKRMATTPGAALLRSHESLFIYGYGKAHYHITKGRYSDVKVPGVFFDMVSIEGIQVYINDLRLKLNGDAHRMMKHRPTDYRGYNGTPSTSDRSPEYVNFTNVRSFLPETHHRRARKLDAHATGKPVLLVQRLLELCTPDDALIYDPFLGSGTTLISAEESSRRVYGMEMSPVYCSAIIERWQALTGKHALLIDRIRESEGNAA